MSRQDERPLSTWINCKKIWLFLLWVEWCSLILNFWFNVGNLVSGKKIHQNHPNWLQIRWPFPTRNDALYLYIVSWDIPAWNVSKLHRAAIIPTILAMMKNPFVWGSLMTVSRRGERSKPRWCREAGRWSNVVVVGRLMLMWVDGHWRTDERTSFPTPQKKNDGWQRLAARLSF